jgi:DNA-directed RNA polymerase subunit M/transcription elongation factor TFIIS
MDLSTCSEEKSGHLPDFAAQRVSEQAHPSPAVPMHAILPQLSCSEWTLSDCSEAKSGDVQSRCDFVAASERVQNDIRDAARDTLAKCIIEHVPNDEKNVTTLARRLERAVHNYLARMMAKERYNYQVAYADILKYALAYLQSHLGLFPEDIVVLKYTTGKITADEVVKDALTEHDEHPRDVIHRMFILSLYKSMPFAKDKQLTIDVAKQIETSCYNAVVKISKDINESSQWESEHFIDIYSTRCGTINSLLDCDSLTCRQYGNNLVQQIAKFIGGATDKLQNSLDPTTVGELTANELCPAACATERAEINKRLEQKIERKISKLFKCHHCGARECTYREVQRRALDEAPDYICVCLKCGRGFQGRS